MIDANVQCSKWCRNGCLCPCAWIETLHVQYRANIDSGVKLQNWRYCHQMRLIDKCRAFIGYRCRTQRRREAHWIFIRPLAKSIFFISFDCLSCRAISRRITVSHIIPMMSLLPNFSRRIQINWWYRRCDDAVRWGRETSVKKKIWNYPGDRRREK